ncbi:MAG: CPBP family intramembrane metalloprotease [Bacteroidales bacterium]|nr:CPBP family intramembrane metalloprotease [Bacteroidales bacterium]
MSEISNNPLQGNNLNVLRLLQIAQTIGLFLIPAWILAKIFGKNPQTYLKTNTGIAAISVILVIILVFLVQPFVNLSAVANRLLYLPPSMGEIQTWMMESEQNAQTNVLAFLEVSSLQLLIFNIIMIAILPALAEEFFFRGIIQKLFIDWFKNIHVGILISAIVFSAFHTQFYTFLPRVIMGIYLGYLFVWSGSLWIPIIAHFINNSVGVIGIYLIHNKIINDSIEPTELSSELITTGIISAIICTGLLLLIRKKSQAKVSIKSNL